MLKKRQLNILNALRDLGGIATTKAISVKANLNTNGVSQSLGALGDKYVRYIGGRGSNTIWEIIKEVSEEDQKSRTACSHQTFLNVILSFP